MMFATALIQSELIMGLGMLLTLMLRDGKIAIYVSFSLLASGSLFLYYNNLWEISKDSYAWLMPLIF